MTWATKIKMDDKSTDVGSVTATFTYPDGTTFSYSETIEVKADVDAYVNRAKAAKLKSETRATKEANREAILNNLFNKE